MQTLVKVWENSKKLWKHSPAARVPTAFLVLPNFHSCLYFYFLNNMHATYSYFDKATQFLLFIEIREIKTSKFINCLAVWFQIRKDLIIAIEDKLISPKQLDNFSGKREENLLYGSPESL